jgi:hypothetical protein
MADPQEFRDAYKAYDTARKDFEQQFTSIIDGKIELPADFHEQAIEVRRKYEHWMELSKPFVKWK